LRLAFGLTNWTGHMLAYRYGLVGRRHGYHSAA
jgi:hypothetical protein